uniref:SEFIR domain-containing protein n=1 Tax=Neogobius melanostomus TaxID=47308 RepID=A0A8C6UHC8_9GOBI
MLLVNRWRWSLFAVAVMMLLSLTLLITFGAFFLPIAVHKAHVLLLSPPDSDVEVSAAVCNLGSLLCSRDFSVTVDQWSRQGQFRLGPLPWSHCRLLSMDSQCERVVMVLTPKAVEKAQTWSSQDSPVTYLQEDSPYSDICHNKLPQILRGLPLFHFPSQTKALLADLCVRRTQRQSDRRQMDLDLL